MPSRLHSPLTFRSVTLRNRIAVSPMCQYSAIGGFAADWHLVHLGRFALGGAGLVMMEATAVSEAGRITHGDVGIWSDDHVEPLARIVRFLRDNGAAAGLQIGHAGRKASSQRPWEGGNHLAASPDADHGGPWRRQAASLRGEENGDALLAELDGEEMDECVRQWAEAARRADSAGFDILEVHAAHGYLLHEFLSPLSNIRTDRYGGSIENRMRFPLRVVEAVRAAWPESKPLFVRISAVDGSSDGWSIEDSIGFARRLKALGVDLVDCSSGGIQGPVTAARVKREPGFQVPFARRVRDGAEIPTMAVGLILHAEQAEAVLQGEAADLVALGRELLVDPNWPLRSRERLEGMPVYDDSWPVQAGWWLAIRHWALARNGS